METCKTCRFYQMPRAERPRFLCPLASIVRPENQVGELPMSHGQNYVKFVTTDENAVAFVGLDFGCINHEAEG